MIQHTNLKDHFLSLKTDQTKIINEFSKPIHQNIFFNNIEALRQSSELVKFNIEKWYMRPEVFCKDYYENPYIYQIILLINNLKSIFEFIPDNLLEQIIITPNYLEIKKLISY